VSIPDAVTNPRPPRFLADENFNADIVRGVKRRRPELEFMTAAEAGILNLHDLAVLRRARELDLILITHDRKTMPRHFGEALIELRAGESLPGMFMVTQETRSLHEIIGAIVEVYDLSSHDEWRNQIRDLPL
jgi:hypothetical protein